MQVESLKYRSHAELDSASQFSNILSADPDNYRDESSLG
jgi:hypothetical protein